MADTPIELAKNVIVDYKDDTSWILIIIVIASGIIQYLQNLSLAKTVETFKSDLSKKEIKFTRHTELQIECLIKMYDFVVSYHFSFCELSSPIYFTHDILKSNINIFQSNFLQTINYCHRNKILLTEEIIEQIRMIYEKFKRIEVLCRSEFEFLSQFEEQKGSIDPQILYGYADEEVLFIKSRVKKLNDDEDIKTYEEDIKKLRELIENYFKQLVG